MPEIPKHVRSLLVNTEQDFERASRHFGSQREEVAIDKFGSTEAARHVWLASHRYNESARAEGLSNRGKKVFR